MCILLGHIHSCGRNKLNQPHLLRLVMNSMPPTLFPYTIIINNIIIIINNSITFSYNYVCVYGCVCTVYVCVCVLFAYVYAYVM